MEFIFDINGLLWIVFYFYDLCVKVFVVMLLCDVKLLEFFNEKFGWLDFFCKVGLKRKVSRD